MKYTVKFKQKCIEMYRQGKWMDTPKGVTQIGFRNNIKYWDKREKAQGIKGLKDKKHNINWTFSQKMAIIKEVKEKGNTMNECAIAYAMNSSTIGRWIKIYDSCGEDGIRWLDRRKKKKRSNEPMKEEIIRQRARDKEKLKALQKENKRLNKIIEQRDTEIAVLKKLKALM